MKSDSLKILYTDDDTDDFELMKECLLEVAPQHTLHYLKHSEKFVDVVREVLPDLIFLDYNMPLCDGKDCLEAIKTTPTLKDIPVIMFCTSSSLGTLDECFQLGAVRYLLKPVNYSGFVKGLNLILTLYYEDRLVPSDFGSFLIDTYKLN
jgi:CheY-like chemotaxis protein